MRRCRGGSAQSKGCQMSRTTVARIAVLALALGGYASPLVAQLGGLKRLRSALGQADSATRARDSVARLAAAAGADTTKPKGSLFSRAAAAAKGASDQLEQKTGLSAKDVALAATGVGVAGIVAKKAGLPDAGSIVGNALSGSAKSNPVAGLMSGSANPAAAMMSGGSNSAAAMMGGGANAAAALMGSAFGKTGLSSAGVVPAGDAAAMLAFQQAMMQTAMAASSGDAAARARLEAWQALSIRYQTEAMRLTMAAAGGDLAAGKKLQDMQITMINEWIGAQNLHAKAVKP